jgi:hypothetical protein
MILYLKNKSTTEKSFIFSDITLCSLLKVNSCFKGTCHLHLQGLLAICFLAGFALSLLFDHEMFLQNIS